MNIIDVHEHLSCFNYDRSEKPAIEIIALQEGKTSEFFVNSNEILFFIEGSVVFSFRDFPRRENNAGEFIFLPCGGTASLQATSNSLITVFRLNRSFSICDSCSLEELYASAKGPAFRRVAAGSIGTLVMDDDIRKFLEGANYHINRGLRCRRFYDLKISEFLLLLRTNYPKKDVRQFFSQILSPDTAFSEYVRSNWEKYPSVEGLSASMNLSVKQFSTRFKNVFHQTPYSWIKQAKATLIQREIKASDKPLKQIAMEYGFNTVFQFTNFCKKELGNSPSQIRKG